MTLEVVLPYPPSVNHYWRSFRGRVVISREGRAFRSRVCSVLAAAGVRPMEGDLLIWVEAYPPDRRRRDIDNIMKGMLDALEHGGAYRDDAQVRLLIAEKCEPVAGGRAVVRIGRYPGAGGWRVVVEDRGGVSGLELPRLLPPGLPQGVRR